MPRDPDLEWVDREPGCGATLTAAVAGWLGRLVAARVIVQVWEWHLADLGWSPTWPQVFAVLLVASVLSLPKRGRPVLVLDLIHGVVTIYAWAAIAWVSGGALLLLRKVLA